MTNKKIDLKTAVYTPDETSAYAVKAVMNINDNKHRSIAFPIDMMDKYFAPVLPGQVVIVQAQTSNYKSSFLHFWERELAKKLSADNREEVIIHVSTEESIEEQAFVFLASETGYEAGKKIGRASCRERV